ncbi:hypothetical protein CPLU01_03890, partial [Colletotrichum plurivorum]
CSPSPKRPRSASERSLRSPALPFTSYTRSEPRPPFIRTRIDIDFMYYYGLLNGIRTKRPPLVRSWTWTGTARDVEVAAPTKCKTRYVIKRTSLTT